MAEEIAAQGLALELQDDRPIEDDGEASSIQVASEPAQSDTNSIVRVLEGGAAKFDEDVNGETTDMQIAAQNLAGEEDEAVIPTRYGHLSARHQALHMPPDPKRCRGCRYGKAVKKYAKRRAKGAATCRGDDVQERPVGACLHLDHILLKSGSRAASTARLGLHLLDEGPNFRMIFPANRKAHEHVLDSVFKFEGPEAKYWFRRWFSDGAKEFATASRKIREQRPLAHYTTAPGHHQANGRIERANRTLEDGTNASLITSAFGPDYWVLAAPHWTAMWNGFAIGTDGKMPYLRRFGVPCPYECYPFGALVFVHPL